MSATIDEQQQFIDADTGIPLNNGKVFFGTQNSDPVATSGVTKIFSDRALSVEISNPQTLDSDGRTQNKVWIDGPYSMQVNNSAGSQKYIELDNGETTSTGIQSLSNVLGGDTITATAATTITSYVDKEQFILTIVQINTTSPFLDIDGVGSRPFKKNHDKDILPKEFEAGQQVIVAVNNTDTTFEVVNQNVKTVTFYEGSPVAAATTTDIWDQQGNTVHVTGTGGPITSFGAPPNIGAKRTVIADDIFTITNSASLVLEGGADFTTEVGDVLELYADSLTQVDVSITKISGEAVVGGTFVLGTEQSTGSGTVVTFSSIPAGTTMIVINFEDVSLDTVSSIGVRIGDAGGIESSGYVSSACFLQDSTAVAVDNSTGEFRLRMTNAAEILSGQVILTLKDATNFTWICTHTGKVATNKVITGGGHKSLSAELTQLTINGTTFDGGSVNIMVI